MTDAPGVTDIREEAQRLCALAADRHVAVRMMGGLAVWLVAPSVRSGPFARTYQDMDFAAPATDRRGTADFFESAGYVPEKLFNALHGATRLNFQHPSGAWTIDVLFDQLEMSHRIDLRGRLTAPGPTVDLADLLLMKLQIWEINRKDLGDVVCLLADVPLGSTGGRPDATVVDVDRVVELTRADWGLCHTVERNLRGVADLARAEAPSAAPAHDPAAAAGALLDAIAAADKTMAWRMRARIGERVQWYQRPEEVRH